MPRRRYDYTKPCAWCNACPSSFCDCGPCNDDKCDVCHKPKANPKAEILEPRDRIWDDIESEGAGGDGEL